MFGQLAKAKQHFENSREACHAFADEIQGLRENYYSALRSGRGIESARNELYRQLDAKDFGIIGVNVISGKDSPHAKTFEAACPPGFFAQPKLSGALYDLIEALRSDMGATGMDDVVLLLDPTKLIDGMRAQHERANAYVHARNLLEIYASGVPMEELFSAETYLKILLEMEYSLPRLGILKPGMDKLPQEHFDLAVEMFGKKLVMEAAETVLKLPHTKEGELVAFFSADEVHGTYEPFDAFNAILKTEPKGFVVFAKEKGWINNWARNVSTGAEYYDELVDRYGNDRVHDVVETLRTAPRLWGGKIAVPDGAGYKTESDLWFLEKLLTDPTFRIADDKDFVYLAAGDIEAIAKSKDKIQVVYGRVNDVRWSDGGRKNNHKAGDFFHVYFAGVSKFGVMIYDHNFSRSRKYFGDDAQGLIGELIRVQGTVWQSQGRNDDSIRPDWAMRGSDGNFWVLAEEKWPDYLPIPDMEPARSLDELRAAVTHIEVAPRQQVSVEERVKEAIADGRGGGPPLMPLRCQEGYRAVAPKMNELSPDQNVSGYLMRMQNYAWKVGDYQALNEMCTSEFDPSVRGEFLTAAVGGFDEDYSTRLNVAVDGRYQTYCRPLHWQCPEAILEHAKAEYEEIMTVLGSGDLQRGLQRTVVVSTLPGAWKSYALTIGQYEVMSEACSGTLDPAIRDDFFAALGSASADQVAQVDTMINESYEKYSVALQESIERQPANEQKLKCRVKRVQNKYHRIIDTLVAEETTTATTR